MALASAKAVVETKAALLDEPTTTLRVPIKLRNNLKKVAAIEKVQLRELTIEILQKYIKAYEVSLARSLDDFSRERRR
ncbi:MAG: hypothetical protein J0L91_00055 [Burkholderiales bacterium]|nr:hypothetical protein [Burkholderiales bacterium]